MPIWTLSGLIPAFVGVTLAYVFDTSWSLEKLLWCYAAIIVSAACTKILFDQPPTK